MLLRMLCVLVISSCAVAFAADSGGGTDTSEVETENQIAKDLAKELGITVEEAKKKLKEQREKEEQEDKEKHEKHKNLYEKEKDEPNPGTDKDKNDKNKDAGGGQGKNEGKGSMGKETRSE